MKLEKISLTVAAALALGLASCSKNEPATSAADDASQAAGSIADAAAKTAEAAKAEAEKAVEAAKAEAEKAAAAAKAEAEKVAAAAKAEAARVAEAAKAEAASVAEAAKSTDNTLAQGLIDKAKGLIAEGKYSDAASVLQQLTGQTLSADQTTLVASLKEQIQKALAAKATDNAAGSVGNLLKK